MISLFKKALWIMAVLGVALFFLSRDYSPQEPIVYGTSFSKLHTDDLGLDWKATYLAILNDLGVRHFRFSAHWSYVEPKEGMYDFSTLDFQIREAEKKQAKIILAVGRRVPGYPECHTPDWAKSLSVEQQREKILALIERTVNRYKDSPAVEYWQVENEAYLTFFASDQCGGSLDEEFLQKEIDLVHRLDSSRKIILTDSGELSTWYRPYRRGDAFGTSIYLYIWNGHVGKFRYPIVPAFFRIKYNLVRLFFGAKDSFVIELSSEPWLPGPTKDFSIETQLERMGPDKLKEMIEFAKETGFSRNYLWGAEWWYWMKLKGHPELWDIAKPLFADTTKKL
jgi:hypothetical protein